MLVNVLRQLNRGWKKEDGLTAVEYAVILGLAGVTIVGGLVLLGADVSSVFDWLNNNSTM